MGRIRELQLDLWREACRHIDIAESVGALAGVIERFVPIRGMWIFMAEPRRCALVAGTPEGEAATGAFTGADAEGLYRFAGRGGISPLNPLRPGRSLLRPLCGVVGPGPVVCGGLCRDDAPEGIVVWMPAARRPLSERETTLLGATLEPISVAVDTSRRFNELQELRRAAEADRNSALRRLGRESLEDSIIGARSGLQFVMERVDMVASSDVPVLLLGETGSGKEVISRAIHDRSVRAAAPFVRVNCGAIPSELIDSQLFGHERGAFTGATERRLGWFERANGGTLFLDEIGELPLAAQVRLLRVLQEGMLERVGGQAPVPVDCRIVAATHRDLAEMVRQGAFREDLWYRLAVFTIILPPLRERAEDLPELAQHFAHRAAVRFGLPEFEIQPDDIELLMGYDWPGNIRELAAVIDRAALLGRGHRLALAASMGAAVAPTSGQNSGAGRRMNRSADGSVVCLDDAVRACIRSALDVARGRVEGAGGAADLLRINPHTLRSKMRKLGIRWAEYRGGRV